MMERDRIVEARMSQLPSELAEGLERGRESEPIPSRGFHDRRLGHPAPFSTE
jgi:hypothetical protein